MAMYVSGGGSGSGTSAIAANAHVVITLLTTPDVANTMYIIQVTFGQNVNTSSTHAIPLGSVYGSSVVAGGGEGSIFKVGPNVAVKINFSNDVAVIGNIGYAYNYISIVMDTN